MFFFFIFATDEWVEYISHITCRIGTNMNCAYLFYGLILWTQFSYVANNSTFRYNNNIDL